MYLCALKIRKRKNNVKKYDKLKAKILLLTLSAFLLGNISSNAEELIEDFENLTLVDAEGNPPASTWSWCYGLSNGWKIKGGGTIDTGGNSEYTLVHNNGTGAILTDWYLSSGSTSVNNSYIFIPKKLTGQVMLWTRSNLTEMSKKTSSIKIYEATAEGELTDSILFSKNPEKGVNTWKPIIFNIDEPEGKFLAINLVYTDIDEFSATIAEESSDTIVTPTLTASVEMLDFKTIHEDSIMTFDIKSNVETAISFDITGDSAKAFALVDAPTTLNAYKNTAVNVRMSAEEAGQYEALLTITAGELTATVALKGIWEIKEPEPEDTTIIEIPDSVNWTGETFVGYHENDEMPEGWETDGWYIGEPFLLDTPAAVTLSSGTLITPAFTVAEGGELQFFFSKTAIGWNSFSSKLEVSFSTDKKEWTSVASYDKYEDDGNKAITFDKAGTYWVRFVANDRTYLNDFKVVTPEVSGIMPTNIKAAKTNDAVDLLGRRITTNAAGLLIVNGKKILRK